jgi:hypothetical protein
MMVLAKLMVDSMRSTMGAFMPGTSEADGAKRMARLV